MSVKGTISVSEDEPADSVITWRIDSFSALHLGHPYNSPTFQFRGSDFLLGIKKKTISQNIAFQVSRRRESSDEVIQHVGIKAAIKGESVSETYNEVAYLHSFSGTDGSITIPKMTTRTELAERPVELLPNDILTIQVSLWIVGSPETLKELTELSQNLKNYLSSGEFSDCTIDLKGVNFKVHKIILAARSTFFAGLFRQPSTNNTVQLLDSTNVDRFKEYLQFVYCAELHFSSVEDAITLYKLGDYFGTIGLMVCSLQFIKENVTTDTFFQLIEDAQYDQLLLIAQEYLNRNLLAVVRRQEWVNLMEQNSLLAQQLLEEMAIKRPRLDA